MSKIRVLKTYAAVKIILERFRRDNLSEYAAYSALFIILSFVPFIMVLLSIIKSLPIFTGTSAPEQISFVSEEVGSLITRIFKEAREKANGAVLSVTTIAALWSASRGLIGIINGLNRIHRVKETRGFLRLRLSAMVYMLLFIAAVLAALLLLVFGQSILDRLAAFPFFEQVSGVLFSMRWAVGFCLLILFFLFVYAALPIQKSRPFSKLPGAVFSAAGWLGFSALYSLYVNRFADYSYVYGSLATIALLILWLYICMFILFLGEELNVMLSSNYLKKVKTWIKSEAPPQKKENK